MKVLACSTTKCLYNFNYKCLLEEFVPNEVGDCSMFDMKIIYNKGRFYVFRIGN